jgi:hypothetical protein
MLNVLIQLALEIIAFGLPFYFISGLGKSFSLGGTLSLTLSIH